MVTGLWDELLGVDNSAEIIEKAKKPKKIKTISAEDAAASKSVPVEDKLRLIREEVYRKLGKYTERTVLITSYSELAKYIDCCIENGAVAIDTETNNTLNTFDCKLMGLCLYTPGQKNAYVPVNHINRETGEKLKNQVTEHQIKEQLQRLLDNDVFEVYHHATFDLEVINNTCGIKLKAHWDVSVAAKLLNENENKALKDQYLYHIDPSDDKYDIESLFKKLPYEIIDPDLFALYAATDSYKTYKLFEYQREEMRKPENKEIYDLYKNIEIPVIEAIYVMEQSGVSIDLEYAKRMSEEYHRQLEVIQSEIDEEMRNISGTITAWRQSKEANEKPLNKKGTGYGKSKSEQLSDPVAFGSPTQLAILLYDVLKVPVVDKKTPRGTGGEILDTLAEEYHVKICELLIKYRAVSILITNFIDKMPVLAQKDGKVHAHYDQVGTVTGRFSSQDPSLQQIPSHDKLIRMMFKPSEGYAICGGDFSGQEPRSLCSFAKDTAMQAAYAAKRDLYADIASKCFHNRYEDNLEFDPITGKQSQEGKARRNKAKVIFLAITYGMSAATLARRLSITKEEAEKIIADFYKGYPAVEKFTQNSEAMAKKIGYVTDIFGRRRHLPDASLPEYSITSLVEKSDFNPLLNVVPHENLSLKSKISDYESRLTRAKYKKDRDAIIEAAKRDSIAIKYNGGFINRAARQSVNARIQGSAASMTKLAMVKIVNDQELNALGFRLLTTVHDEVFGEAPVENVDRAAERLCELMVEAAKDKCSFTTWAVDPYKVVDGWYEDENISNILKDYNKALDKTGSVEKALSKVYSIYKVFDASSVKAVCEDRYETRRDSLKYGLNYYKKD